MIALAINTQSDQPFDFSEFYLTKLPVFKFNINVSTIGEPFTDFCVDLIYETVKNLVIARQLSYVYAGKSFWTNGEEIDWFVKRITTALSPFSWLEQQILNAALHNKQKRLTDFISTLLSNCDQSSKPLSRHILYQVATSNQSGLITTSTSKRFLFKQLNITLNGSVSLEHFIKTEGRSGTEYLENEKFKHFSESLFAKLRRQFINPQND